MKKDQENKKVRGVKKTIIVTVEIMISFNVDILSMYQCIYQCIHTVGHMWITYINRNI